ncbi:MAG TPA: hypothetical protein VJM32_01660 [Candidatus Saccharimonadales bacterium]|nr:hypothetical protein [Candidatus Saccharimonadales bacterium]
MSENSIAPTASSQARARALQQLRTVAANAQEVLASATTVFPLDLFPDTVTVDRSQVTLSQRTFFWMGDVTSIRIEDILNVTAQVGPFFGSVRISTRYFDPDKPYEVTRFWREDALRLQAVIQGLMIALKKDIDASAVDSKELAEEAERLGQPAPTDIP